MGQSPPGPIQAKLSRRLVRVSMLPNPQVSLASPVGIGFSKTASPPPFQLPQTTKWVGSSFPHANASGEKMRRCGDVVLIMKSLRTYELGACRIQIRKTKGWICEGLTGRNLAFLSSV